MYSFKSAQDFTILPYSTRSFPFSVQDITASECVIRCDDDTSSFSLNLPTAVNKAGKYYWIGKTSDNLANAVTINTVSSQTITPTGATSTTLNTYGEWICIASDGANWQILDRRIPSYYRSYTPTITGAGTPTSLEFVYKRQGDSVIITGNFTTGTCTGVTAAVSLPTGLTIATLASLRMAGRFASDNASGTSNKSGNVLISSAETVMNFAVESYTSAVSPLVNGLANSIWFDSTKVSIYSVAIPISGWKG